MILLLLRHGIADDADTDSDAGDSARALTKKGKSGVECVGKMLRELKLKPDFYFSSRRVRAVESAEIVAKVFGFSKRITKTEAIDFDGIFEDFADELNKMDEKKATVLAASHEPFCGEFLREATGAKSVSIPFKKGAVAVIEWEGKVAMGTGKFLGYLTPDLDGAE